MRSHVCKNCAINLQDFFLGLRFEAASDFAWACACN